MLFLLFPITSFSLVVLFHSYQGYSLNTISIDGSGVILPPHLYNNHISAVTWFENIIGYASISNYNAVLSNLLRMGYPSIVLSLAQQLEESHSNELQRVLPDIHTWTILIKAHSIKGDMSSAISLFCNIINTSHHPTNETSNLLLDGFCHKGETHKAMLFYNDIIINNGGFQLNHDSFLILITGL